MKIKLSDLKKNANENFKIGNLRNFEEEICDLDKYNLKNRLNELTLEEWIYHTNSIHNFNKSVAKDIFKKNHPATFEEELPFYYINFFSKRNEIIFDPFLGTGTTCIVSQLLGRKSIGIEINQNFVNLTRERFQLNELDSKNHLVLKGNCYKLLKNGTILKILENLNEKISFTITSPPYHNILKSNYSKKRINSSFYTNYGDSSENLENIEDYNDFLDILTNIFKETYQVMKTKSYLLINVRNYYRKVKYKNGRESQEILFFAWDLARKISKTRWIPCGEQIWVYPNKQLFPFGYPYIYLSNITHSYNLIFYKDTLKK